MSNPLSSVPFEERGEDAPSSGDASTSWSGEAERIVDGVQRWLTEAAQGAHGGLDTGTPTCGVCPVCRAVEAVRTADPALLAAGLEVATSAALSIAEVLKRAADDLLVYVTHPPPARSHARTDGDGESRTDGDVDAGTNGDDKSAIDGDEDASAQA